VIGSIRTGEIAFEQVETVNHSVEFVSLDLVLFSHRWLSAMRFPTQLGSSLWF
jgi:hypothetical protein